MSCTSASLRRHRQHGAVHNGVDKELVEAAVARVDPADEEQSARALVQRRLRNMRCLEPHVATRRLLRLLARKGYPSELAFRVIREELGAS